MNTLRQISERVGIPEEEIIGKSRIERIATARQVYWYCLNLQNLGCRKIARLDGRSKQAILSGIRSVKNLLETNHPLVAPYKEIIDQHLINNKDAENTDPN